MARNIVILSDGTGQGASMPDKLTNVCKLWHATRDASADRQVAFYDAGLGASDGRSWWRWGHDLLSKATGLGISRNIKDCYGALIKEYTPGDHVFLFGFSRGAYTVRSLGGVLSLCGIPTRDASGKDPRTNQAARDALVEEAVETVYKHYGNDEQTKEQRRALGKAFRDKYASVFDADPFVPFFIGVWDTVRALGIPGSSGLIGWRHAFHDATLNRKVRWARQALAIDENRKVFAPEIWNEREETAQDKARGRIKQVWFAGAHSDIGGGYPETELADLTLDWMIKEATAINPPLIVDASKLTLRPSHKGQQHDERTGWGHLWVQGTRESWAPDILKETEIGSRFGEATVPHMDGERPYRPHALRQHKAYKNRYTQ
jgi:uncharacterized protein (DUF2235 family)